MNPNARTSHRNRKSATSLIAAGLGLLLSFTTGCPQPMPAEDAAGFADEGLVEAAEGSLLDEIWRFDFQPQNLPDVELRDYYPFGVPTANEIGVYGRRYWTDWLPRLE